MPIHCLMPCTTHEINEGATLRYFSNLNLVFFIFSLGSLIAWTVNWQFGKFTNVKVGKKFKKKIKKKLNIGNIIFKNFELWQIFDLKYFNNLDNIVKLK